MRKEELICHSGDRLDLDVLFHRFNPHLQAIALKLCGNTATAEDAVQDAWMIAYTHIHQLKRPEACFPWLRRIVINSCYQMIRKNRRITFSAALRRFHRVHHSDYHLNVSSALRFHPGDVVVSQCIYQCVGVMLIGLPMPAFVIYGTIAIPLLIMQHSNVRFPRHLERFARLVIATPGWHKIHHSAERAETDSHYGDVFTFWDRIFGTWGRAQPHEIKYGLNEFDNDKDQKVGYLMSAPFKKIKPKS